MKIVIIGAGAMGCLYGSYLSKIHSSVWLLDPWEEHVLKIQLHGLRLISAAEEFLARPKATTFAHQIEPADLIIICVKSHSTAEAALTAELYLKPDTMVITMQNGLGNAEQLAEALGAERIFVGTTLMGATVLELGVVMHGGIKNTHVAAFNPAAAEQLPRLAALLEKAGLPTVIEHNVNSLLWSKLSIHAGFNAVTALTGATNHDFLQSPTAVRLARMAVAEVAAVATAAGTPLLYPNCAEEMLAYVETMRETRSPMLQDVQHKRHTEVDVINGAVVRAGRHLGIPTPVNETFELALKTIEQLY